MPLDKIPPTTCTNCDFFCSKVHNISPIYNLGSKLKGKRYKREFSSSTVIVDFFFAKKKPTME